MEILHIIPVNATYIIPLADMLQCHDKENNHVFMVTTTMKTVITKNAELLKIRGLQFKPAFKKQSLRRDMKYIADCAKKADRVVWHTFRTNDGYCPYVLYKNRNLLKKSTWIAGEGELGNYTSVPNKRMNRRVQRVNNFVQRNIACIGIDFTTDTEKLSELGLNNGCAELTYPCTHTEKAMLQRCLTAESTSLPKKMPMVQIGLSSQRMNRHVPLMNALRKMPGHEDCCAVLNFCSAMAGTRFAAGTRINKSLVQTKAASLNCRLLIKDKVLSDDQYFKALQSVDLVLLANKESCQMHTLLCLLAMKKRVFAKEDSPLYAYLNETGANIHPLGLLTESESLEEIMELPAAELPGELIDYYSDEKILDRWLKWAKTEY